MRNSNTRFNIHKGFTSSDYKVQDGWMRLYCAQVADGSCGLVLFQHHFKPVSEYFDHLNEANLGLVTGGSFDSALKRIDYGGEQHPVPAAYRRISRLLQNGEMVDEIKNTLSERGLLRIVGYTEDGRDDTRLQYLDRAGFRTEERKGKSVRILDLE